MRWCWVNFQCRGVLQTWITVGQGPTALAVGAGGGCLDIFTLNYPFILLSPSLWETTRYRLKYCLKGPLNPNQPTNGWHRKQLFSSKASLWGIVTLQIVQHGLVGLGHRASQPIHFKRPHRASGPPATTFQFTGLVKIANADPRGDFLLFEAKSASRDYRGGLLCQRLGLDGIRGLFVS